MTYDIPSVPQARLPGVISYMRHHDARLSGARLLAGGLLAEKLADIRRTALEKIQRPFFQQALALTGDETVDAIAARFAQLRTQLGLQSNPPADIMLAFEQCGRTMMH